MGVGCARGEQLGEAWWGKRGNCAKDGEGLQHAGGRSRAGLPPLGGQSSGNLGGRGTTSVLALRRPGEQTVNVVYLAGT